MCFDPIAKAYNKHHDEPYILRIRVVSCKFNK